MSTRFSENERALVDVYRALVAYTNERTRADSLLEEPRGDEEIFIELHADGSGSLRIKPDNPNERTITSCTWGFAPRGAELITAKTAQLAQLHEERKNKPAKLHMKRANVRRGKLTRRLR